MGQNKGDEPGVMAPVELVSGDVVLANRESAGVHTQKRIIQRAMAGKDAPYDTLAAFRTNFAAVAGDTVGGQGILLAAAIKVALSLLAGSARLTAAQIDGLPTQGYTTASAVVTALSALSGTARLPASAVKDLETVSSGALYRAALELLTSTSRLNFTAVKDLDTAAAGALFKTALTALVGTARLPASAIDGISTGTYNTADQLVTALAALVGAARLPASAVQTLDTMLSAAIAATAAGQVVMSSAAGRANAYATPVPLSVATAIEMILGASASKMVVPSSIAAAMTIETAVSAAGLLTVDFSTSLMKFWAPNQNAVIQGASWAGLGKNFGTLVVKQPASPFTISFQTGQSIVPLGLPAALNVANAHFVITFFKPGTERYAAIGGLGTVIA